MDKPNINIKDILSKVSFLRNNLALMVPILIAVVALLLFIPTRILSGKLRETVTQESARTAQRIDGLMRQVDRAAEAQAFEEYIEAYARDANQIEDLMRQTTLRELLSYQIFPDTNETSPLLFEQFGRRYMEGVENLLASLQVAEPPTDSEIEVALQNAPRPMYMSGRRPTFNRSDSIVPGQRGRRFSSYGLSPTDRKIVDTICAEKAQAGKVYASPVDFAGYSYWDDWAFENRDEAYKDCWYWQLGYWVIDDVATTVRQMNAGASGVLDAPVKRVMSVSFTLQRGGARGMRRRPRTGRRGRRRGSDEKPYPTYVTSSKDVPFTVPFTGRYSNEELDVIQFEIRAIVASDDVMAFMQELCSAKEHTYRGWYGDKPAETYKHNQITVLESNMGPVEPMDYQHDLYRYGDEPVIDLDLICEYIFQKGAYDEIKPQQVKDAMLAGDDTQRR